MGEGDRQRASRDAANAASAAGARNDDNEGEDEGADDNSPVHRYITEVYKKFTFYEKMNGTWPQDVLLGKPVDPWVKPPHHCMGHLENEPSACYLTNLLIWNPWSWNKAGSGAMPNCPDCGEQLNKHGSVRKRMLVASMEVSWCMTPRFICHGCEGCKNGAKSQTFNDWDPEIRKDLPSGIQHVFCYDVQHCALVDTKLTNELVVMALNNTSVAAFTRIIEERAQSCFFNSELAWEERLAAAKIAEPQHSPFLENPGVFVQDFGRFGDRKGYDGWCPKQNFWHRMLRKHTDEL
jgi:hypothetical protein